MYGNSKVTRHAASRPYGWPRWLGALKNWERAFRQLAQDFRQAPSRSQDVRILQRDVGVVFPLQAGRLLCDCLDRGGLGVAGIPEFTDWDLRKSYPDWTRESVESSLKIYQEKLQRLPEGDPGRDELSEEVKTREQFLRELSELPSLDRKQRENVLRLCWMAFIRWHLAPMNPNRFRADWNLDFNPGLDALRTNGPSVHTPPENPVFTSTPSLHPGENIARAFRVWADVQATAATLVAEHLKEELEFSETLGPLGYSTTAKTKPADDDNVKSPKSRPSERTEEEVREGIRNALDDQKKGMPVKTHKERITKAEVASRCRNVSKGYLKEVDEWRFYYEYGYLRPLDEPTEGEREQAASLLEELLPDHPQLRQSMEKLDKEAKLERLEELTAKLIPVTKLPEDKQIEVGHATIQQFSGDTAKKVYPLVTQPGENTLAVPRFDTVPPDEN